MIELLIVLVIAAILASIAWPAYTSQVLRGRRSDAMSALAEISQAQERWRSDNPAYASTVAALGQPAVSRGGHYDLSIIASTVTAYAYTLQATVKSSSPQANDSRCQTMKMELAAGRFSYTSSNSVGANGDPDPCWVR